MKEESSCWKEQQVKGQICKFKGQKKEQCEQGSMGRDENKEVAGAGYVRPTASAREFGVNRQRSGKTMEGCHM